MIGIGIIITPVTIKIEQHDFGERERVCILQG